MLGAATVAAGAAIGLQVGVSAVSGAIICFALRLVGMHFHVGLPRARRRGAGR